MLTHARDGFDDYPTLEPKTVELEAFLLDPNFGGEEQYVGYKFNLIGTIATGLGPGKNIPIADIDRDGVSHYNIG